MKIEQLQLRSQRRPGRTRAFTIVEILVAVGILAIVAIAVATIFRSISQTVVSGRKVSELNKLAAQFETIFRKDIDSMARDGILVIRHEYADAGKDISLVPDDRSPRKRRVDQLMFLARGDYETTRPPIYPGITTRASEARVYYGHGQRRVPDYTDPAGPFLEPDLRDDGMSNMGGKNFDAAGARLGFDPGPGGENPNRYASGWTLLRHVTLLAEPEPADAKSLPNFGAAGFYGFGIDRRVFADRDYVRDAPYQIDLQPAMTSLFWNTQGWIDSLLVDQFGYIESVPNSVFDGYGSVIDQLTAARFSSGLIDVASTTIDETMSVVGSAAFDPFNVDGTNMNPTGPVTDRSLFDEELTFTKNGLEYPQTAAHPPHQRWWMINALPTPPAENLLAAPSGFGDPTILPGGQSDRTSPRMRYEPLPPNLAGGMLTDGTLPANLVRLQRAYRDADQETLTRSVFLPRCTEFIVEWSYGWTYTDRDPSSPFYADPATDPRYGQLVWFGRDRFIDHDADGAQTIDEPFVAQFYQRRTEDDTGKTITTAMKMSEANRLVGPQAAAVIGQVFTDNTMHADLSGDQVDANFNDRSPSYAGPWPSDADIETAAFGPFWLDTSKTPPEIHDWPWPKLLRITIKLAGEGDASDEQTYQSVFEVPRR